MAWQSRRGKRYGNRQVFVENLEIGGKVYQTWQGDASMKRAFGLRPSDKWPDSGMSPRLIQGVTVIIRPKDRNALIYQLTGGGSRRCLAMCNDCGKWFDAGHLGQHIQIHNK